MEPVTMEKGLELEPISEDAFRVVQKPFTWASRRIVPGGLLMALCANAAYQTISPDFSIASLQSHFLLAPRPNVRIVIHVQRLSDGGRFATRVASLQQDGKTLVHVTCSFVRTSAMGGPSMQHSVPRRTDYQLDTITLDDLDDIRNDLGPYMKYQRFPLVYAGREQPAPTNPTPEDLIHPCAAVVSPAINSDSRRLHLLGIILLSDYHVLDCAPTVHGIAFGQFAPNDTSRTPTPHDLELITSLNHNIFFHIHDGFRADEICYVEATCPWTRNRTGEILTRIFSKDGRLVATCKQQGYYVLKGERQEGKL